LNQHFHPEFGYLHPVPRLRRDLRVACAAFACGAALGAVAIVALNATYREGDNASAAGAVNTATASAETTVSRPAATSQQRPDNGALIARVPLGRPENLDRASWLPPPAETVHISQPIEASRAAQADADKFPGLTTAEVPRKPSNPVGAPQERSSRKVSGGPNLLRKEGHTRRAGDLAEREESTPNTLGSAYARGRTVFWDWSR
jgi:hypothetical protein